MNGSSQEVNFQPIEGDKTPLYVYLEDNPPTHATKNPKTNEYADEPPPKLSRSSNDLLTNPLFVSGIISEETASILMPPPGNTFW